MRRIVLAGWLALAGSGAAAAEEIRILSVGPLERGLLTLGEAYRARTGHEVVIETGPTPFVVERLEAGARFDLLIATRAVVDAAAARGQVDPSTAAAAGRVGIGIAVRDGVQVSARSTEELTALFLSADTVAYNRGSSGVYSRSMIESLGIAGPLEARTTEYDTGTEVLAHVREGRGRDLGLAPLTEIQASAPEGIRMIPLPDPVQNYTAYFAVVGTPAVEAASDFLRLLSTPEAREAFAATGVD